MNRIIEKIKNTVEKYELIKKDDNVVVGFSGGPDSTCLLHSLWTLKDHFGIDKIAAVHINHMYRGEDAFSDEKFCEDFCKEKGILFFAYRFDVEKLAVEWKTSSEDAGRIVRYNSFREVADKIGGAKIAVAHNRQDQAETLLMRLARGTGTEGLCGIDYIREGQIIRPILTCDREEIENYCMAEELFPKIDHTNLEPIYTRNVVRLKLIPYINEVMGCNIVDSLAALSDIAKEDRDFIAGFTDEIMQSFVMEDERGCLQRDILKGLHTAVRKRVIVKAFGRVGLMNDIGSVHLAAAEELLLSDKTSLDLEFPHKYVMKCRYDKVYFEKVQTKDTQNYKLECRIIEDPEEIEGYLKLGIDKKNKDLQIFDYDKIIKTGEPILRYREAGDVITPKGFSGTKKLKDYFIDRKIDKDVRGTLPLLCAGKVVLWIQGHEVNEKYLPDEGCQRLLEAKINM
ncbi:MAG: tRNA lysidine(34) synthetase TilS [Firmicutes bacterium]|nr:tRNA lysidine(34) synthetase TilS [Bacillota bacterium]